MLTHISCLGEHLILLFGTFTSCLPGAPKKAFLGAAKQAPKQAFFWCNRYIRTKTNPYIHVSEIFGGIGNSRGGCTRVNSI